MHKFAFKTMQQRMIRERKFPNTDVDERSPLISNEVRSDEPVVKQGGGHVFLVSLFLFCEILFVELFKKTKQNKNSLS